MITAELGPRHALTAVQTGTGRDIVLVHGSFATHQDWTSGPISALARLGRLTAIDRPGHGESRRPRLEASPNAQADQMATGLAQLGVSRPVIVGHSFGALVALAYARRFPVSGLVLVSPIAFPEFRPVEHSLFAPRAAPVFGPFWAWGSAATSDRPLLEAMHRLMFAPKAPPDAWRASYPWQQVLSPAGSVANGEDMLALHPLLTIMPDWSDVVAPSIVISGGADLIVDDRRQAIRLADALPSARHVRLTGAGHMLHHTHIADIVEAISDLLAMGTMPEADPLVPDSRLGRA